MSSITYFVALPFIRTEDGALVAGEAVERPNEHAAIREAIRLSASAAGSIAFSRTGDLSTGEFEDAVVIKQLGEVLTIEDLLSAS